MRADFLSSQLNEIAAEFAYERAKAYLKECKAKREKAELAMRDAIQKERDRIAGRKTVRDRILAERKLDDVRECARLEKAWSVDEEHTGYVADIHFLFGDMSFPEKITTKTYLRMWPFW